MIEAQTITHKGTGTVTGNTFTTGGNPITSGGAIVINFGSTNSGVNTGITDDDSNSYTTVSLGCQATQTSWCFTLAYGCNLSTAGAGGTTPTFTTTWASGGLGSNANVQWIEFSGTAVSCHDVDCVASISSTGSIGTVKNGCSLTTTNAAEQLVAFQACHNTLTAVVAGAWTANQVAQSFRRTDTLATTLTGTYFDSWTYNTNNDDCINSAVGIIGANQPGTPAAFPMVIENIPLDGKTDFAWIYVFSPAAWRRRKDKLLV